jgi:ribosomal-protein-alanine N-acetyltransferase
MIRPFSLSDLNSVLQVELQSFPKSPYDWTTFVYLHCLYPETFLVYIDRRPDQTKDQILGYIVFSPNGHIVSIAVRPQFRKKGIGRRLIERAMNSSLKKVWAEVRRSNKGAQAFYLNMGFQAMGEIPNYYGNEDALIVQWNPSR